MTVMAPPSHMDEGSEEWDKPSQALVRQPANPLAQATAGVIASRGETASSAIAAQAKAEVESRYLMALQQPRSYMKVRVKLLDACQRTGFAATARYAKPVGKGKVVGWSIRFAEEVARSLTNVIASSSVIYDSTEMRIVRVMVTDLEANLSYPTDVTIAKTVERRYLKDGQTPIASRMNSTGQMVYLVEATDDDVLNKENALKSKAMRSGILRIVPGDILEECEAMIAKTLREGDSKDPAGTAKTIADSFYALGVSPERIEKVLGHTLTLTTPAELTLMREWYTALKEGESSWEDIAGTFGANGAKAEGTNTTAAKGTEGTKERMRKAAERTPGQEG